MSRKGTAGRVLVIGMAMVVVSCGSANIASSSGPCAWVSAAEASRAIGIRVLAGYKDPDISLCTYEFTSRSGVNTDLVVGPVDQKADTFRLEHHQRIVVNGLGARAVFLRANSLDDGNSVLIVTDNGKSFLIGSEFLSLDAAKQLGAIVLRRW